LAEGATGTSKVDYEDYLYTDEPLADEAWYKQYLEKSDKQKRQTEMLQSR
jgi:hypothetical protein